MNNCKQCGVEIRNRISLCKECRAKKRNSIAFISQNKKKLRNILNESTITVEWLDKFILYANNIVKHGKVFIEFIEKDTRKRYDRIKKSVFNK